MSSTSYMPAAMSPFATWATNFTDQITLAPTVYGLVAGDATAAAAALTDFTNALAVSTTPATRTPVSVAETRTFFATARDVIASKVEKAQASGLITEEYAALLGITFRKTTKTPVAVPTATPSLDIERSTSLNITLRSKVLGAVNNALPAGSVGYQVWCLLNPTSPPSTPDNFTLLGNGTRRFYTQTFDGTAVGKQCYYAIRYVNARQEWGPWSNIVGSTVVST